MIEEDLLADEQQIYLSWVDQVNVGESVHSLQARVDTTVQLQNTHNTIFFSFFPPRIIHSVKTNLHGDLSS